jgi:DNA primase
MIPEAILNQIQDRLDIVEVVGAAVPLRRAGRNFKANCPFHNEKSPSFIVNPDKQIFHCFGCGVGGNVFSFLMKFEKKDFLEVVQELADRVGVELPKNQTEDPAVLQRSAQLVKANEAAMEFYHRFLRTNAQAKAAREYLEKRGISEKTLEGFKLGYAPEAWDGLYQALKGNFSDAILEKTGLVISKKNGGFYDRFRNRIIFPIVDGRGLCVAFGGRVMDESLPKYLNSPETEIYVKGRNLYGFFQARKAIRENDAVIVVEGYMDLIACHQAQVTTAVASLGTALTPDQARLVKRNTGNVFIVYDADKAGEMATLRGLEIFLEEGLEVKIVRLPQGHDPDSFIRSFGAEKFKEALAQAKTLFEYKLALLKAKHNGKTLEGRVKIANEMVTLFAKVKNEILKAAWAKELAGELGISEDALLLEMKKTGAGARPVRVDESSEPAAEVPFTEKIFLGLLLENPAFASKATREVVVDDFRHPAVKKIIARIFETPGLTASQLINFFSMDAEAVRVISMASAGLDATTDKKKAFLDCLAHLRLSKIRSYRETLRAEIANAERSGDQNRIGKLLVDLNELNKKEKQLNEKK